MRPPATIAWDLRHGMAGTMEVAKAGEFYLEVTSHDGVEWIIRAKEGKIRRDSRGETIVAATAEENAAARGAVLPQASVPAVEPIAPAPAAKPSSLPGAPPGLEKSGGLKFVALNLLPA